MPSLDNQSNDSEPKANGYEVEIEPRRTLREYKPEDFSQAAINDGQRRINYELTAAAQKLSEALRMLTAVLAGSICNEAELAKINKVIAQATAISSEVASIKPPGCKEGGEEEEEENQDLVQSPRPQ